MPVQPEYSLLNDFEHFNKHQAYESKSQNETKESTYKHQIP